MKNCALYARVSTEEQARGLSIETQLEAARNHAAINGWQVAAEYVEPGKSATSDRRPEFQKMIRDALTGKFTEILVYSYDRFARNMEDAVVYKSMLRRDGVDIISVLEPIDKTSPFSFIHEGIIDLFAAYYSINLSAKIRAGLEKKLQSGGWPWPVPLGYRKNNGKVLIDPVAGPFMTLAFTEFASGNYTLESWTARALKIGVRSQTGRQLSVNDWSRLFNNPFYAGALLHNETKLSGQHYALTDLETWSRVQLILDENRNNQIGSQQRFYLLRNLLWSVETRSGMVGAVGKNYRYYRSKEEIPDANKKHYVLADDLENQLTDALSEVYLDQSQTAPSTINEAVVLALRVASVGRVLEHLPQPEKRSLLVAAVTKIQVSDSQIVDIKINPPFFRGVRPKTGGDGRSRTGVQKSWP